jgi:hypothetical protein
MTLGVIKSAAADRDNVFSQALRTHAKSLDLATTMPVGTWTFGQGIRKARNESFFWELSSSEFSPLGLHHPTALVNTDELAAPPVAPQIFPSDLLNAFPQLANWTWTLLSADHAWLKREWTVSSAWKKSDGPWLMEEDATLKDSLGWQGFSVLPHLAGWAVKLNSSTCWVASPATLPQDGLSASTQRAQLRLFLSTDALGPEGRLQEWRRLLISTFPEAQVTGLNVRLTDQSTVELAQRGLSCDDLGGKNIGLCFPLSFLKEDLAGVVKLLSMKG